MEVRAKVSMEVSTEVRVEVSVLESRGQGCSSQAPALCRLCVGLTPFFSVVTTTELTQVIANAASWMFSSRKDDTGEDQGPGGGIPTTAAECIGISRAECSWVFPRKQDGEEWRVRVFPAQNSQLPPPRYVPTSCPGHQGPGKGSGPRATQGPSRAQGPVRWQQCLGCLRSAHVDQ